MLKTYGTFLASPRLICVQKTPFRLYTSCYKYYWNYFGDSYDNAMTIFIIIFFFRIHNIYFMNITIKTELLKLGLWMNTKWTWWIISFLYWYIYSVIIYRYILYGNYLFILILHCPFVKQKKMESVSLFILFKERVKSLWMFKSNGSPLPSSLSASTLRYTVLILLYLLCTSENRTHTHEDTGIDKPNVITLPFETSRNCSSPQLHHHFPFCSCFKFAVYWILQISSNDVASTLMH